MLRYGTVCSGVEAFGPAWEAMGYECAFHAEIAAHPSAVLRYHYPTVPNYGDFSQIQPSPATWVDVLCGGTPCQDFSVAGLRKGLDGKRGNLTLEFARLAERLRPRWLVWENVPGVLSADGGRAFGQFLTLLAECGYYAAYRVLDAQHFGVPQRRRRVFLVAYLGDWRPAAAVLFESQSLRRNPAPGRGEAQDVAGTIEASLGRSRGAGTPVAALTANGVGTCGADDNQAQAGHIVVSALTTRPYADNEAQESRLCITGHRTHVLTAEGHDASEDGTGRGTPIVTGPVIAFQERGREGGRSVEWQQEQAYALLSPQNGGRSQERNICANSAVRRLTPVECERLMGYPDNWTEYGTSPTGQVKKIADGPRYQMCGNGWATPVANWVAQRLMMVEKMLPPASYTIEKTTPETH